MNAPKFYTKYDRPPREVEKGSGEILVNKAGYLSAKIRIENIMDAGRRLLKYREEQYDFNDDNVDLDAPFDPLRNKGLDYAEITEIKQRVDPVIEEIKRVDKKNKEDKLKAEQDAFIEEKVQERLRSLKTEKSDI